MMKTLEETYDWVAVESGYPDKVEMFKEITGTYSIM